MQWRRWMVPNKASGPLLFAKVYGKLAARNDGENLTELPELKIQAFKADVLMVAQLPVRVL